MSNTGEPEAVPVTPVQSVDRAVHILELLAEHGEAGVTEIAAALNVHKSTAFRLVASLEGRGLVDQNGERGKYRLGTGLIRLAGSSIARLDVVQEGRAVCRALAASTGETANLAVLSDGAVLYLDQAAGLTAGQLHNWVGQRVPVHATANGRVLLADLTDDQVAALVGEDLPTFTPATLATAEALVTALVRVRQEGFALVVDELEVGLTAVAAPIRSLRGDVVASVSVSGPSFRMTSGGTEEAVSRVRHAAAQISHRLGWAPT